MSLSQRFSTWTLAGIGFVTAGFLLAGSVLGWLWITDRPVSIPASIASGKTQNHSFRSLSNQNYIVAIEARKNIPFDDLNCMLGTSSSPEPACSKSRVLYADWVLQSDGVRVAHGSTEDGRHGAWGNDTIECQFGGFRAQAGKRYTLSVTYKNDGQTLAVAQPRVIVEAANVDSGIGAGLILWPVFLLLECIGGLLLLIVFCQRVF